MILIHTSAMKECITGQIVFDIEIMTLLHDFWGMKKSYHFNEDQTSIGQARKKDYLEELRFYKKQGALNGCEIGKCPSRKVEVGAIYVVPPLKVRSDISTRAAYHLFILYTENGKQIVYHGRPEAGNKYAEAAQAGNAQELRASEPIEGWDLDYYWGMLITHRMEGMAGNQDLILMVDSVTVAEGPEYCGLDGKFTDLTRKVGELGQLYDPANAIRTDNSNAMVRTVLHYMELPEIKPGGGKWVDVFGIEHEIAKNHAPGFGNIFELD